MKSVVQQFALLGALALGIALGAAQTLPKRGGLPGRIPVPRNPVPAPTPPVVTTLPVAPATAAPAVRVIPRGFNLDTALAKILTDAKLASATGEFELCLTNGTRIETNRFPMWVHLRDGQVRTELDITTAPGHFTATGPFAPFRQEGITRLVNLTVANYTLRKTYQLFPEKKAFVSRDLAPEDMPLLVQLQKQPVGPDTLEGAAADKWLMTLVYPTGEKRTAQVWQMNGIPRQVRFTVGDSRLTIRFREAQKAGASLTKEETVQQAMMFALPSGFAEFPEVGDMLAMLSARRVRSLR